MKNRYESLGVVMELLQDEYLEEALNEEQKKSHKPSLWK